MIRLVGGPERQTTARSIPAWLSLLLLCLCLFGRVLHADARSFVLSRFDVDLQVLLTGDLLVTETVSPRFEGSWNGIERLIPVEYRTPQGFNYRLLLDMVSVTDEQGTALKFESSRERHYRNFRIWMPGATDATRTFVLKYRVRNGLKFFDDHDELYWNVTGDEWDVPIEQASARIPLPPECDRRARPRLFTGAYGAREEAATVSTEGSRITMTMTTLGFREDSRRWSDGTRASCGSHGGGSDETFVSNWALGIPLLVFLVMYRLWSTRGRIRDSVPSRSPRTTGSTDSRRSRNPSWMTVPTRATSPPPSSTSPYEDIFESPSRKPSTCSASGQAPTIGFNAPSPRRSGDLAGL